LPYFRRYERYRGGESQYHGGLGEFRVSDLRTGNRASAAWVEAGVEFGLPRNPDFNGATTLGVGAYQLGIGRHWRSSSASAFLRPVAHRPNLTVITAAQVSKVLLRGRAATGVEWIRNGKVFSAAADREVVLSAGALQSPQLLQLSGIGPADLLRGLGIAVVVDAPEVGRNLQDHYQARMIVRLKQPISLNDQVRNPYELAKMGLQWMLAGSGPLTAGAGQVGGAACTEYAVGGRPDIQFNVMPLSVDKPGDPLHRYSGFTASAWQCHGESRGQLAIRSTDPFDQPRIEPNYFAEEIDRKTIVAGLHMLRDIYRQRSFRDLWDIEMAPGEARDSPAALWDFARTTGGTVFHAVGTCRMGSDDRSVLDPQLRVRGVENLRVIDASVMPRITSANTNASSLMIGERGAALIMS
jgi:choline dehydrogenase